MGNRAVIIEFGKTDGIYLHWNGGRDSIEPILYYAKHFMNIKTSGLGTALKKVELLLELIGLNPEYSNDYTKLDCDNYDNGVYVINNEYEIIARMFNKYNEQDGYNKVDFLIYIDENMPKRFQKGKDYILKYLASKKVDTIEIYKNGKYEEYVDYDYLQKILNVGDIIYINGEFRTIIGKNDDYELRVNGSDRKGCVFFNYTELYEQDDIYKLDDKEHIEKIRNNPNSYIDYNYATDTNGETIKIVATKLLKVVDKLEYDELVKEYNKRNKQC